MRALVLVCLGAAVLLVACDQQRALEGPRALNAAPPIAQPLPLGDLAGPASPSFRSIANPYAGDAGAVEAGRRLFMEMNCAYCHGIGAGGLIGPSLKDPYWRYGGSPVEIFLSILQGRPKGMPAWGEALPATSLWQITAYLQSLTPKPTGQAGGQEGHQSQAGGAASR